MIARLKGKVLEKHPNHLVVDVHGVGYQVLISITTFYKVGEPGSDVDLTIHTHVREDAILLFGFLEAVERSMFNLLITVTGIGPKLALNILSGMETPALARAIGEGAHSELTKIPGLGKKTADRILVELRDKVGELMAETAKGSLAPLVAFGQEDRDVLSALTNLGYKPNLAEQALAKVKKEQPGLEGIEALLRETLKSLSKTK